MQNDPKGYYAILGVLPSATPALIRAAYRVRAMELHPDRKQEASATREFQELQGAFEVLSDPAKRAAYDAASASSPGAPPSSGSTSSARRQEEPRQESSPRWDAITCTSCGVTTAQPRYREFLSVVSFIVSSTKTTHRGIFCAKCETKTALSATGRTLILGWWNHYGFFWTLEALLKNLSADASFAEKNARLLAHQAMHFATSGNLPLARAIAMESLKMAMRAKPIGTKMRAKLGYDVNDPLKELREGMESFLESTNGAGETLGLKERPKFRNLQFGGQALMIMSLVAVIGVFFYNQAENTRIETERREAAERARLEREGIERQRAVAIAAAKAEELRKLELPLPKTGKYGFSLASALTLKDRRNHPGIKITASPDANYMVKLLNWDNGVTMMMVFIRANETFTGDVPIGHYRVRMAAGSTWYGDTVRFGPNTQYSEVDRMLDFRLEGDHLIGHELILAKVANGNMRPVPISADTF